MLRRFIYERLDRWTEEVRRQTKLDMQQLRAERAGAEQPLPPRKVPLADTPPWWQSLRQVMCGGMPALERAILGMVLPHVRPEDLLPDATLPR